VYIASETIDSELSSHCFQGLQVVMSRTWHLIFLTLKAPGYVEINFLYSINIRPEKICFMASLK